MAKERTPRERGEDLGIGGRGWANQVERIPVRQIQSKEGGLRVGVENSLGNGGEHSFNKVVPWTEGSYVKSFLFKNFPPASSEKELIGKFQEVGAVVDLFCPKKRYVHGNRFGFVRFKLQKEEEGEALFKMLNTLWMGTYKLRVFTPLFERGSSNKVATMPKNVSAQQIAPQPNQTAMAFVDIDRSFSNVVKGHSEPTIAATTTKQKVTFIPIDDDKKWLENAQVGLLKEELPWEEFSDDIQKEVEQFLSVKTMGEGLVLINEIEGAPVTQKRDEEWEKFWFRWIRPWKPEDVSIRRPVWMIWYGVPFHAWSERFFR